MISSPKNANFSQVPSHFDQVKSISIPRITTITSPPSCRCFHRFSSFHSTAHLGMCRQLAEGCCFGVFLNVFVVAAHSAPHFREPTQIWIKVSHYCKTSARHLYISILNIIIGYFHHGRKVTPLGSTHTEAPWESGRRFRSFFAQLPTAKEWTLKWYSHGTKQRWKGGVDILLVTTTWKWFYVQGPHSPFSQGLQFSG